MKQSILFSCVGTAALGVATLVQAAVPEVAATPQVDLALAQQARAQVQAQITGAKVAATKTGVAGAKPGGTHASELFANPDRAYPPSCLNSPMPLGMWQNDPNALVGQVKLIGDPYAGGNEATYSETVKIYVFRVACTSGLSATLMEIDRPSSMEGNTSLYPTLPAVSVAQGSNNIYVRLANDPNTFFSTAYSLNPLINSDVFVLENFYGGSIQLNYNNALTLTVDTLNNNDPNRYTNFPLSNYNPSQYPAAALSLPISGYMTGNWYDITHSGEGIQVEVGELQGSNNPRYITIAWYTYDSAGIPYWLFGSGVFNSGDTSATVTLGYSSGGSFAGSGASATQKLWGTFNVQFPSCNTMQFTYQSAAGLPAGVPTGSGTKSWTRLTQMNGLTCM
ncbi:MAG: hypothetical protein DYH18_04230 [Xanthomonadales bacterium PRO7]|nr:hypothetical protein [Xanthomonadales bacterium PRO7]HMM56502.1 hypothetical protein [Rudaea sp.]